MTPLMNAARLNDDTACVANLVAAGARLEDRDKFGDTALAHAVTAGRDGNVKALLAAGAKDFRVTAATGRRVADGDAPLETVRGYVDALHRGDFQTMARLMAHTSVKRMEDRRDDLPLWQSLRPKTFTLEEGWMSDDAATLTIRGATPTGERRISFQVERKPEGSPQAAEATGTFWQIRKEWFLN
jgi:ankyrin repeat protein